MERLYKKLKESMPDDATIVWATTTPVPPSYPSSKRSNRDVVSVNAKVTELFGPTGKYTDVLVSDFYQTLVDACHAHEPDDCYPFTCDCPAVQNDGVHLSSLGARLLAIETAAAIAPYREGNLAQDAPWLEYHSRHDTNTFWAHLASWEIGLLAESIVIALCLLALHLVFAPCSGRADDDDYPAKPNAYGATEKARGLFQSGLQPGLQPGGIV